MTLKKYIGDRKFYRAVLAVAVPIMIQNGFTNLVNMLDNVMVGRLGTESMSGVSIVNQFIFIFNLLIFGAVSAAGIFTAQYHGMGMRRACVRPSASSFWSTFPPAFWAFWSLPSSAAI